MLEIFDRLRPKLLKDLGEVSRKVMAQPTGSFANNSGTFVAALAEKAGQGAEQTLTLRCLGCRWEQWLRKQEPPVQAKSLSAKASSHWQALKASQTLLETS
jgi:hypothetical protein